MFGKLDIFIQQDDIMHNTLLVAWQCKGFEVSFNMEGTSNIMQQFRYTKRVRPSQETVMSSIVTDTDRMLGGKQWIL